MIALFKIGKKVNIPVNKNFDLLRYLGTWYEIAHTSNCFENRLSETTAQYTLLRNGRVRVTYRGYDPPKIRWRTVKVSLIQKNKNLMKLYIYYPFVWVKYNVAFVDETYSMSVVSGGNNKFLWLLVKDPKFTSTQFETMMQVVKEFGCDPSDLIFTEHQ